MTPTALILIAVDVVAALILAFGLYYPRHRRRDLVVAFLGVNIGVLAVTSVLGSAEIAAGLGLGLFGVLSIIRLRSSEISQREVAYYFAALATGLIGGLAQGGVLIPAGLIALILVAMWGADHPALLARSRHQVVRVDRAIADEGDLRAELEARLGASVTSLTVQQLDLVNDSTLVDVRYRIPARAPRAAAAVPSGAPHSSARAGASPSSARADATSAVAQAPASSEHRSGRRSAFPRDAVRDSSGENADLLRERQLPAGSAR